jgi:hypothetical protein
MPFYSIKTNIDPVDQRHIVAIVSASEQGKNCFQDTNFENMFKVILTANLTPERQVLGDVFMNWESSLGNRKSFYVVDFTTVKPLDHAIVSEAVTKATMAAYEAVHPVKKLALFN